MEIKGIITETNKIIQSQQEKLENEYNNIASIPKSEERTMVVIKRNVKPFIVNNIVFPFLQGFASKIASLYLFRTFQILRDHRKIRQREKEKKAAKEALRVQRRQQYTTY